MPQVAWAIGIVRYQILGGHFMHKTDQNPSGGYNTSILAILDRIQPTIRRDCNYYNLDKIKDESEHNGEVWVLPKLRIIKDSLPNLRRGYVKTYGS